MGSIFKDSKGRSSNYYLLYKTAHGWRKKSSGTSIAEFVDQWLAKQRGAIEGKAYVRYEQVLRDLEETLGVRAAEPFRRFAEDDEKLLQKYAGQCAPAQPDAFWWVPVQ